MLRNCGAWVRQILAGGQIFLWTLALVGVLWGGSAGGAIAKPRRPPASPAPITRKLSEVSPPSVLQELRRDLEIYQPQVKILSPRPDQVLQDNQVSVRFQVRDLPLFKSDLGLGPHLHVFLDNQPYQAVYSTDVPLVLTDLAPGTHTLRVFASRPWHESFKNEGAYAQTSFHVLAKTGENQPLRDQPLLTYSRPQGNYGAEPVLLDFYLTNAPLHLIAQESREDDIKDWKIRCTVNGESFTLEDWQPIYLKGLKPGQNWVQLELIDEKGNAISNAFNNTVRVITYEPGGTDTLSQLVRGELTAIAARTLVDPNYTPAPPPSTPAAQPIEPTAPVEALPVEPLPVEPLPEAAPTPPAPLPSPTPAPEPAPAPEVVLPSEQVPAPEVLAAPAADQTTEVPPVPEETPLPAIAPTLPETPATAPDQPALAPSAAPSSRSSNRWGSFLGRYRKAFRPAPSEELPTEPTVAPPEPEPPAEPPMSAEDEGEPWQVEEGDRNSIELPAPYPPPQSPPSPDPATESVINSPAPALEPSPETAQTKPSSETTAMPRLMDMQQSEGEEAAVQAAPPRRSSN